MKLINYGKEFMKDLPLGTRDNQSNLSLSLFLSDLSDNASLTNLYLYSSEKSFNTNFSIPLFQYYSPERSIC